MKPTLKVEADVKFSRRGRGGRRVMHQGAEETSEQPAGRLPRITRLMALAIRFEQLIRDGVVADYAELARLGKVSRARVTQVMNLLLLAPDIQEEILFLPRITWRDDQLSLREFQQIALKAQWQVQRRLLEVRMADCLKSQTIPTTDFQ